MEILLPLAPLLQWITPPTVDGLVEMVWFNPLQRVIPPLILNVGAGAKLFVEIVTVLLFAPLPQPLFS